MHSDIFHDQELVGHLFAPVEGPARAVAEQQIRSFWVLARDQLGIDVAIPDAEAPRELLADAFDRPDGTVAVAENRTTDFQLIARRVHDVMAVSMVFAAAEDTDERRRRIGSAAPPGWRQFHRWWKQLCVDGVDAMLGTALVFQAKVGGDVHESDLAVAVPVSGPWMPSEPIDPAIELTVREICAPSHTPDRVLFVDAPIGRDDVLSEWSWSDGTTRMPRLTRYLLHAAELRYQERVLGSAAGLHALVSAVRSRLDQQVDHVVSDPEGRIAGAWLTDLRTDELLLRASLDELGAMAHAVEIAEHNMAEALREALPGDRGGGARLRTRISDETWHLEHALARVLAQRKHFADTRAETAPRELPDPKPVLASPRPRARPVRARSHDEPRLAFTVDASGYSRLSNPEQVQVQQRIAAMVERALGAVGLTFGDTDPPQHAGDGLKMVLPRDIALSSAAPDLLVAMHDAMTEDNATYRARLRLRAAATYAMYGPADLGASGRAYIELARLVDSEAARQALRESDSDLIFLVSDSLYQLVFREKYVEMRFEPLRILANQYDERAWLWMR